MGSAARAMRLGLALLAVAAALGLGADRAPLSVALHQGWERTGLTEPVVELWTPTSGAFLARTPDELLRSDDAGQTWRALPLPTDARRVVVDPTSHQVLYADGVQGLYRSTDEGASWQVVLPLADPERDAVLGLAASGVDPALLYLGVGPRGPRDGVFRFLRSADGGATWEELQARRQSMCAWSVRLLVPHPTDRSQVFRTAGCYAGRDLSAPLDLSVDLGASWATVLRPEVAFPARLVGGLGSQPSRFYLSADRDFRAGGSTLYRSDDDGRTWTEILSYRGGGTIQDSSTSDVRIGGLAYDPLAPDRIYVGLARGAGGVRASADGGTSWTDLDAGEIGPVTALALGIDAANLYAGTEQGLWRLPLR